MFKKVVMIGALLLSAQVGASTGNSEYYFKQATVLEGVARASYFAYGSECDGNYYEALDDPRKFALAWLSNYSKEMKKLYKSGGSEIFKQKGDAAFNVFFIYSAKEDAANKILGVLDKKVKIDDDFKFQSARQLFRTGELSCDDAEAKFKRFNDIAVTLK
ncbi:hypothetical protein [Vibrio parahaemolyticus]|uniref:hypothetical protein n=1 Tax=Vibrio parahaemolyticus TaxID=670 RepID=UPI002B20E32D|nr:hypothetical protein [Vibrio parahaemolyticus]MEA5281414.1 hypothetical protein [Vibrio parahaemolyticus]